jgi:mitogen-activated protein kinase kinase
MSFYQLTAVCLFNHPSLIKDPADRPGPKKMLEHPFIQQWQGVSVDIASWVKEVWGWQ